MFPSPTQRLQFLAGVFVLCTVGIAGADEPAASPDDFQRWIAQLGSKRYAEREHAMRELTRQGPAGLASLKAWASSPDAEVRRRVQQLIERLTRAPAVEVTPPPAKLDVKIFC